MRSFNKFPFLLLFMWMWGGSSDAQRVVNVAYPASGLIDLTDEISVPRIAPGYTVWMPESSPIRGLIVFFHSRRDTLQSDALIDAALENQLAVAYVTTDHPLDFLFDSERTRQLGTYIAEIVTQYDIPGENLLFCGMSLAGTRALKTALYMTSTHSDYRLVPRAVAVCDAPLDMVRFHKEMVKAADRKFEPISANEGQWVSASLEEGLGGSPSTEMEAYLNYSPYSDHSNFSADYSGLLNTSIRAYTEPDVLWWMENRGKDYYGMNALDMAGLINALSLQGHKDARLILTQDKGRKEDGSRHPHSWSIVDEAELIQWFVGSLDED